jgi:nitrile hydratase
LQPGVEAQPEPVYAVRFDGVELWGDSAEPNSAVYIDMWESYLEPA